MLETMNQYSDLSFAKRRERYEGITKIIEEGAPEVEEEPVDKFKSNKTFERIMNEPLKKNN